MKTQLLIFPFNGNGIEALDCIDENQFELIGFIDDNEEKHKQLQKYPLFKRVALDQFPNAKVLAVPGSPTTFSMREDFIQSLNIPKERFATIIHPKANIGKQVSIGYNTLIMAGVVITSNAKIKNHICILPNTVIHHDTVINNYTLIGSNVVIAGGTIVEENCYIGSGTNIINGIKIGTKSLIGLGSNVTKSIQSNSKAVGNPARLL